MVSRSVAPPFSKDFSFQLPQPEIFILNNGVEFIFLPVKQDVIKLDVVFRAGRWHEPHKGISHFTSQLLDKGTHTKSAKEISEYIEYHGASIELTSGYDFSSASLYSLNKNFEEVFPLFADIVSTPSFPEAEFELSKEQFIQELKINNQKNSFVASRLIRKNIFGENHPYGQSMEEADVLRLSVADLQSFHASFFSPVQVYLIGNVDSKKITELIGHFSSREITHAAEKKSDVIPQGLSFHQPMPNSLQAAIRFGKTTIHRSDSEYPGQLLLIHLLGGYFGSRLMKNIREEKGLTYGIHASVHSFEKESMIAIGAEVNVNNLNLATDEILKEIDRLKDERVSDAELSVCKNHFLGSLQLDVANPFAAMDKIKAVHLNRLDKAFYEKLFQAVQSLSADDIQSGAKKYLHSFHQVSAG
ncbi:MAG: insulinase family protein [Bacteroidetes bacterium]|nr:insulinase family protein [Bacteroidota bacterium]MBS1539582.1 insulinase family protein [Bacteroidota bacterium]